MSLKPSTEPRNFSSTVTDGAEEWDDLIPLDSQFVPSFPVDALPSWARAFVIALAEATQTPEDLPAMLVLAALSVACAQRCVVAVTDGYLEPVNLFVLLAMDPGNRKSAVCARVMAPIVAFETSQIAAMEPVIAEAQAERQTLKMALRIAERELAKAKAAWKPEMELRRRVDELAVDLARLTVPPTPCLAVDDITAEKVAMHLVAQGGRLGVISADGGGFLDVVGGRYDRGGPNIDVYLKGHAGDALRIDRVGRGTQVIQTPALTLGLAVQPGAMRELARNKSAGPRGLLARFLYSLPVSKIGHRDAAPPPVPKHVSERYGENLSLLLDFTDFEEEPKHLHLSTAAHSAWLNFVGSVEPRLAVGGDLHSLRDWAAKLPGAVLRIAGLLQAASQVTMLEPPWGRAISEKTMTGALAIADYLVEHARAAFIEMRVDRDFEIAQRVLQWIAEYNLASFTRRDLFERMKGSCPRVADLKAPLEILVERNYIHAAVPLRTSKAGRPPGPRYMVNPSVTGRVSGVAPVATGDSANTATIGSPSECAPSDHVNPAPSGAVVAVAPNSGDFANTNGGEKQPTEQTDGAWEEVL